MSTQDSVAREKLNNEEDTRLGRSQKRNEMGCDETNTQVFMEEGEVAVNADQEGKMGKKGINSIYGVDTNYLGKEKLMEKRHAAAPRGKLERESGEVEGKHIDGSDTCNKKKIDGLYVSCGEEPYESDKERVKKRRQSCNFELGSGKAYFNQQESFEIHKKATVEVKYGTGLEGAWCNQDTDKKE